MGQAAQIMEQMGGAQVSKIQAPFLHKKVARLVARAGIPMPAIFVIPDSLPNACAVGLADDDMAIAVTSGLLTVLDEHQIEAVLAHEVGHIQHGHSVAKTKVALKGLGIAMVGSSIGRSIATSNADWTPDDDNDDDLASTLLKLCAGAAVAAAGNAVAAGVMGAAAFRSEFEADDAGGRLSKKPWALASALQMIEALGREGSKKYASEVAQLFILAPDFVGHKTHPDTRERVQKLERTLLLMEGVSPETATVSTLFCTSCGEKTDADGKYCYWCGSEVDNED
jgi:heat shock protein HtpX